MIQIFNSNFASASGALDKIKQEEKNKQLARKAVVAAKNRQKMTEILSKKIKNYV